MQLFWALAQKPCRLLGNLLHESFVAWAPPTCHCCVSPSCIVRSTGLRQCRSSLRDGRLCRFGWRAMSSSPLPQRQRHHWWPGLRPRLLVRWRRSSSILVGRSPVCGSSESGGVAPSNAPRSSPHASSSVALRAEVVGGPTRNPVQSARTEHTAVRTSAARTGRPAQRARFEHVSTYVLRLKMPPR